MPGRTMNKTAEIYDTTLRDGTQAEGLSPTVGEKLRVVHLLDELGVHFIEGGWPGANPKDDEFFARARQELKLGRSKLVAFGSTRRPRGSVGGDAQLQALLAAETDFICIVGKSWDRHVTEALKTSLEEGLDMVGESITFLSDRGKRVFFDAEHFFDGFGRNPEYALSVIETAARAGAERVVLCDTNGGALPHDIAPAVESVKARIDAALGVHFHNDSDCAVANSLTALSLGVHQVQGCINGYGERRPVLGHPQPEPQVRGRDDSLRLSQPALPDRTADRRDPRCPDRCPPTLCRRLRIRSQGRAAYIRAGTAGGRLRAHQPGGGGELGPDAVQRADGPDHSAHRGP